MRSYALLAMTASAVALAAACSSSEPAPQSPTTTLTREQLLDPATCKGCHPDAYREWSGSMHAYAADDPVFRAMNARGQRETKGALGTFCVGCHAPMAVRDGLTKDGLDLDALPAKLKGVTCYFCHTVDRVEGTHNAPLHLAGDATMRGGIADPAPTGAHGSAHSPLLDREHADSARMCGACHDITNDHGAALERTFAEWQASVFSQPGGATCSQCHMEQSKEARPIATPSGSPPRRAHGHGFPGVDVSLTPGFPEEAAQRAAVESLLGTTLQSALCVKTIGDAAAVRVLVDNVAAGHAWPSGASQDRRVFFEVIAEKGGARIYSSGVVSDGTPVTATLASDPDLWLLRDCIADEAGKPVHMFWEAAQIEPRQLPAQVTFNALDPRFYQGHIVQSYPRSGSTFAGIPDRVTLRVRVSPIGLDVLDDLVASGDLAPDVRARMPTFDVGETLVWTKEAAVDTYLEDRVPVSCVTKTNFNVQADKTPAPPPGRCGG